MAAAALTPGGQNTAALSGDLTLHTVTALIADGERAIRAAQQVWTLDLSAVNRFSSAGVALLLNWMRFCESEGKSLRLVNIPEDMRAIISVCDLEDVFAPLTA